MRKLKTVLAITAATAVFAACTIVRPGEVGMIQKVGVIKPQPIHAGARGYNPFTTKIIKVNVRVREVYSKLIVPTKEGLSIDAEISLLYHINPDSAKAVYVRFGQNFEEVAIMTNFRATTREITAKYFATELYSTEREKIESAIKEQMIAAVHKYGFVIDAVLLKDIVLPDQITKAIQNKVQAQQEALQMEYVILKQQKEAERLVVEAEGIKKAQDIINSAMTPAALKYKYIEMMKNLSTSPNAKVIITGGNGDVPIMVGGE
ncbi:prohibitin family protein [Cytophaga aurantiaca]|uniref:prohibitin family protein n=1 Tax=Cytophaga aurantiaca TaxID=29530 RepID=UPI00035FD639|nr:prohibitin family protein [Cytophaga aurantiaca]